ESLSPPSFAVTPSLSRSIPNPPFENIRLAWSVLLILLPTPFVITTPFPPLKAMLFPVKAQLLALEMTTPSPVLGTGWSPATSSNVPTPFDGSRVTGDPPARLKIEIPAPVLPETVLFVTDVPVAELITIPPLPFGNAVKVFDLMPT